MELELFKGKVFSEVKKVDDFEIIFKVSEDEQYKMHHIQDCCESVTIEDINGDLKDLENTPILSVEEKTKEGESDWGSETYTFYTFRTSKGSVDIRWYGESNGYYSESVDITKK